MGKIKFTRYFTNTLSYQEKDRVRSLLEKNKVPSRIIERKLMNRKRVNLTIDENWLKIAKKYAIDHNTSVSRIFEAALKKMMRVEKEKTATTEDLSDFMHKIFKRIDIRTDEIKHIISETQNNPDN